MVTFVASFGMTVAVLGAVLYLVLHIVRQPQPRARPQGMHFATLILSPFTPVVGTPEHSSQTISTLSLRVPSTQIEHEPSAAAMNAQLLVLLLLAAGLAVFVWFQGSSPRRK